jgi:hypothetical protein
MAQAGLPDGRLLAVIGDEVRCSACASRLCCSCHLLGACQEELLADLCTLSCICVATSYVLNAHRAWWHRCA